MLEWIEVYPYAGEVMSSLMESALALFLPRRRRQGRPAERLRAHYLAERAIADRIRAAAGPQERRAIFATMYDELFAVVPDHPRLTRSASTRAREDDVRWNLAQLRPYLFEGCTFLEVGAGDCALAARVASGARQVYAVDISDQAQAKLPGHVKLVITDGRAIDVPPASVDVAFSDQLMEHLHPDDAVEQLANIHRALKPGGVYVCITPNAVYGPSDVSASFDEVARGFHLKEYRLAELRQAFRRAGFPRQHVYVGARGWFVRCPAFVVEALEAALGTLPHRVRRRVAGLKPLRALLNIRLAGIKG